MHSPLRRLGHLLTYSVLLLAVLCAAASFSDILHSPSVRAHGEVMKISRFRKRSNGNDEVSLNLNISADLSSIFTWNTKQVFVFLTAEYDTLQNSLNQVSLWDRIIHNKDHAKLEFQSKNKYLLIDQGSHLLGKEIKLVLNWHVMQTTGRTFQDKMPLSHFKLPDVYI